MLVERTAGPHSTSLRGRLSTSLRSGRDDNSYLGTGCECPRKLSPNKKVTDSRDDQGEGGASISILCWWREQQVPIRRRSGAGSPLRCAPVGMTIHIWVRDASAQENCHPIKKSQTLGMTKGRVVLPLASYAGGENSRSPFDVAQGQALHFAALRSG